MKSSEAMIFAVMNAKECLYLQTNQRGCRCVPGPSPPRHLESGVDPGNEVATICNSATSYPGSSRLSIWRRVLRRPSHTADHVIKICPSRMDKYVNFFKMAARNKVREIWVRQLPTNKMEYEDGIRRGNPKL